ncbi:GPI inositol-deacylase-like isoform X1 [Vespa mandarinia]|uniref:GPI inositol-deacylase-like isoform X1 n=1 Tax=Vespa mandarinia TaxID=7446 RepID=UPI001614A088|nr:GPI inositol-deacylase-like isoform X1 [Vespa mandarinia]
MIFLKSVLFYCSVVILFLFLLLLYILGGVRYITDFEENTCEMTYMFEYPQYVRIALDDNIENKYPRFGLYAYGEGFVTEKLRRMYFTGIPVLFIPGNVGSHEQVRSIASVSLRKSQKDRTPFHFDFFTVSLGRDYSALYGGVLMEETMYVFHCINKILSLYKGNMDNVILIGHSMGGIIAKGAILLVPNAKPSTVSIIINLATPSVPSLVFDNTFATYYYNLEKKANQIKEAGITVVSITGGPRDIVVPSNQAIDPTADINILTTNIPDVWKSTDHLCILWCKQLVLSIVRFLFDSVDYTKKPAQIYNEPARKLEALSYHFLHRSSGKKLYHYKEKFNFDKNGEWIENIQRQYTWESKVNSSRKGSTYLMIRLTDPRDHLTIETINLETKDWLFVCFASNLQDHSRVCDWGWNLTNRTRMAPDYLHKLRRVVDLDTQEIKYPHMTHIIIRMTSEDLENNVIVTIDAYSREKRILPIKSRTWSITNLFNSDLSGLMNFGPGQTRYYVTLDKINAINVELKNIECKNIKGPVHTSIELLEPWNSGASQTIFLTEIDNGPKTMKVQTHYNYDTNVSAILRLTLEQKCAYKFNIKEGGIIDQISCLVRDRWSILHIIIISLLLIIISLRIDSDKNVIPPLIVTMALCIYFGLVFESCVALTIICLFAIGTCCSVIFLGSLAHGIAVRFLARAIAFSVTWADWLLGGLNQLPFFTTILVISLVPATCGALSMIISVFLHFLKLTRMYEDYLEELLMSCLQHFTIGRVFRSRTKTEVTRTNENSQQKIIDYMILFILLNFTAISAIPSVLVWAKNFSYSTRLLTEDSILLVSWEVLAVCSTLELVQISSKSSESWILSNMLRFLSWILLSTAATVRPSFYQWFIPPSVAIVIAILSLYCIINNRLNS